MEHVPAKPSQVSVAVSHDALSGPAQSVIKTAVSLKLIHLLGAEEKVTHGVHEIKTMKDLKGVAVALLSLRRGDGVAVQGRSFSLNRERQELYPTAALKCRLQRMFS